MLRCILLSNHPLFSLILSPKSHSFQLQTSKSPQTTKQTLLNQPTFFHSLTTSNLNQASNLNLNQIMKLSIFAPLLLLSITSQPLISALPTSNSLDLLPEDQNSIYPRDAYTNLRSNSSDVHLDGMGKAPKGAYVKTIPVVKGGEIPTWYSESPNDESKAESAFIIVHGKLRNANSYFTVS